MMNNAYLHIAYVKYMEYIEQQLQLNQMYSSNDNDVTPYYPIEEQKNNLPPRTMRLKVNVSDTRLYYRFNSLY